MKCLSFLLVLGIAVFLAGRFFPRRWIFEDSFPFNSFAFEKEGNIYNRIKKKSLLQNLYKTLSNRLQYFSVSFTIVTYNDGTKSKIRRKIMTSEIITIKTIRANYLPKEITKFDELKQLNKKVKRPAEVFAYVFGSASSLVLGTGMSLAMKVIGVSLAYAMPLGIGVGLLGILLVSINYPIYKGILNRRQSKYASQIIELTDSLLNK